MLRETTLLQGLRLFFVCFVLCATGQDNATGRQTTAISRRTCDKSASRFGYAGFLLRFLPTAGPVRPSMSEILIKDTKHI